MEIAYSQTPGALSLTGNAINFKVAVKNAFNGAPVKHAVTLNKNGAFVAGQTMQLAWGVNTVILTVANAVVADTDLLPTAANADIVTALNSNATFANDYLCAINTDGLITIDARQPGSGFIIAKTGTVPVDLVLVRTGVTQTSTAFLKTIVKVETDGQLPSAHVLPVVYDAAETPPETWTAATTGYSEIDMAEILRAEMRGHFNLNMEGKFTAHNIIKNFRLYSHKQSGIPAVNASGKYSPTFAYMQGKLENFRQGELNYTQKTFADLLTETGMFLTFAPQSKVTDIYAPERLYFPFLTAGTYKLWCRETHAENSFVFEAARATVTNAAALSVYEFDVSYKAIRSNFDKTLVKYEVWITGVDNAPISETREFVMDYTFYNNARYFYFLNSLGVYECMRTTGEAVKNRNINKGFINIPYDKRFTNIDRQEKQLSATTELSYEMNSGYFANKYWADYFQQFLESKDVYWLKKGTVYAVSIRDSKNKVQDDGDYNPSANFTCIHQMHDDFTENFVATEPISVGDFNFDFNSDFFVGSGFLFASERLVSQFQKTDCGEGYNGTMVDYVVPAGAYTSTISQDDANRQAYEDAAANGSIYANNHGFCVFVGNLVPFQAFIAYYENLSAYGAADGQIVIVAMGGLAPYNYAWSDGGTGSERNNLAAGNHQIVVTDSVGNSVTLNQALTQPGVLYWNDEQKQTFRRNNCAVGLTGSLYEYIVEANSYSSPTSKAHADQLAVNDIYANGQNAANLYGTCDLPEYGSLEVYKDMYVGNYAIDIDYEDGTHAQFNQNTAYPVQVKQINAVILITVTSATGSLNGETIILPNSPTLILFRATNSLVIEY